MYPADAMVHPDFRRCGVLTEMVTHAHAIWRGAGALFVPALLNEQWKSRKTALQWQKLFPLQSLGLLARWRMFNQKASTLGITRWTTGVGSSPTPRR